MPYKSDAQRRFFHSPGAAKAGIKSSKVKENAVFFQIILEKQKMVCSKIEELCKSGLPQGTIQMLGNIADKSEVFQYKLKQRLVK